MIRRFDQSCKEILMHIIVKKTGFCEVQCLKCASPSCWWAMRWKLLILFTANAFTSNYRRHSSARVLLLHPLQLFCHRYAKGIIRLSIHFCILLELTTSSFLYQELDLSDQSILAWLLLPAPLFPKQRPALRRRASCQVWFVFGANSSQLEERIEELLLSFDFMCESAKKKKNNASD